MENQIQSQPQVQPQTQNFVLPVPCRVVLVRDRSLWAFAVKYVVTANRKFIGFLKNGNQIVFETTFANNVVTARSLFGVNQSITFTVPYGASYVEIHFKGTKFNTNKFIFR